MFKNRFLVCFRLVIFVSDACMRKNRFLVCLGLLVLVFDTCMQINCFLVCFWLLVSICASFMYVNVLLLTKKITSWGEGVFMFMVFISATCMPKSYSMNYLGQQSKPLRVGVFTPS